MSATDADRLHDQAQQKLDRCRAIAGRSGEVQVDPWSSTTPTYDRTLRQMHASEGILAALLAIDSRLAELG
jgi:hypothetical protein